jgi:malate dehydrogenase (oxaloacetate-decarboxylating)(NADP+)
MIFDILEPFSTKQIFGVIGGTLNPLLNANLVSQENLDVGTLYPLLTEIRNISLNIAAAVAVKVYECSLAKSSRLDNLRDYIEALMYQPDY